MGTIIVALGMLLAGGVCSLIASSRPRLAVWIGAGSSITGCALGLTATASSFSGPVPMLRRPWDVPYGELALSIDPLASIFLLIVFGLSPLAALYGAGHGHHDQTRPQGLSWLCFNVLTASMAVVVMARNGVLFLVAWEVMALSSFLLVTWEDGKPAVRDAGRLYLVATHAGTAFLLLLFAELARRTGSMDFDAWAGAGGAAPLLFLFALVGFGTKAGLVPFHVWLPEAHPAAPSHVSAVMSGVMIKMGIYGVLRAMTWLGPPPAWWGGVLIGVGIASALIGVLSALTQQDIKRLLAYSSVENCGLITIGLGLWLLGGTWQKPDLAALGLAAALMHVLNHALFKGLLFMGAGAVVAAAGTRQIDRLGGLLRRMPGTGLCLFAGASAIAALPPWNGFVSEFLLYLASYEGVIALHEARALLPLAALTGLALAGGLAAACFARLFGMALLGVPRSSAPENAREPSAAMLAPMVALAALCLAAGLFPGVPLSWVSRAAIDLAGAAPPEMPALSAAVRAGAILLMLTAALAVFRTWLLSRRPIASTVTWDCGYERPSARMQYTASSFAEPIREMFRPLLPARRHVVLPEGFFPAEASFRSEMVRPFQERFYRPAFGALGRGISRLRWLHHGRVQLYVLYIVVTLILMLAWFLYFQETPR